ncbi:MAG: NHL repeat-containing protein [Armatimonadota bacterium]|nr:NHL repeat-containing protein [Armatimonadota bacterium]
MSRIIPIFSVAILAIVVISAAQPAPFERTTSELDFQFCITGFEHDSFFGEPSALALDDRNGLLYVADLKFGVSLFTSDGVPKEQLGIQSGIEKPVGLAVDSDGNLYVANDSGGPIRVIAKSGEVTEIEIPVEQGEEVPKVGRITFDRDGNLYLVDRAGCRIYVFDKNRKLKLKFGAKGDKRGQFKSLCDVAVDRQGRVYALDASGTPVQVFDKKGKYLFKFGFRGGGLEDIGIASGIFVDRHDQIWIVDKGQHCLKVFDRSGTFLRKLGVYGTEGGSFFQPIDMEMDKFGRVYVAEAGGRRVQVFSLVKPYEPFQPADIGGDLLHP